MLLAAVMAVGGGDALAANPPKPLNAKKFDSLATAALEAMKQKAAELKIGGVAVVNYVPGSAVAGWSSKMAVVDRMTDPAAADRKGNNLLAIAYAKSAEMARTLVNSGTAAGPIMTGEFGWQRGSGAGEGRLADRVVQRRQVGGRRAGVEGWAGSGEGRPLRHNQPEPTRPEGPVW